jgi:hypothetical protein
MPIGEKGRYKEKEMHQDVLSRLLLGTTNMGVFWET